MNRMFWSVLASGAAAASAYVLYQSLRSPAPRKTAAEAVNRWEEEGGSVPDANLGMQDANTVMQDESAQADRDEAPGLRH